jgi:hypothetical protein
LNSLKQQAQPPTQTTKPGTQGTVGKEKMEEEVKPLHYDVSYSSVSSYKDGKRDIKEKFNLTNPDYDITAERVPGKDEFRVKTVSKSGDKPETKEETMSGAELKRFVDKSYTEVQNRLGDEAKRLGLPLWKPTRSIFGSQDVPMIGYTPTSTALQPTTGGSLWKGGFGTPTLFDDEIFNIEREMDWMRRRMEDEMRRFF